MEGFIRMIHFFLNNQIIFKKTLINRIILIQILVLNGEPTTNSSGNSVRSWQCPSVNYLGLYLAKWKEIFLKIIISIFTNHHKLRIINKFYSYFHLHEKLICLCCFIFKNFLLLNTFFLHFNNIKQCFKRIQSQTYL